MFNHVLGNHQKWMGIMCGQSVALWGTTFTKRDGMSANSNTKSIVDFKTMLQT